MYKTPKNAHSIDESRLAYKRTTMVNNPAKIYPKTLNWQIHTSLLPALLYYIKNVGLVTSLAYFAKLYNTSKILTAFAKPP